MSKSLGDDTVSVVIENISFNIDNLNHILSKILEKRYYLENFKKDIYKQISKMELIPVNNKVVYDLASELRKHEVNLNIKKDENSNNYVINLWRKNGRNVYSKIDNYLKDYNLYQQYIQYCRNNNLNMDKKVVINDCYVEKMFNPIEHINNIKDSCKRISDFNER